MAWDAIKQAEANQEFFDPAAIEKRNAAKQARALELQGSFEQRAQETRDIQGTYGQRAQDQWGMEGMKEAGANARADMQAKSQQGIHAADTAAANWRWTTPQEAYRDVPTKRDPLTGEITSKVMLGGREVDADPAATAARRAMDKYAYMSKFDPKNKDHTSYLAQEYNKETTDEGRLAYHQAIAYHNPNLLGSCNAHLTDQAKARAQGASRPAGQGSNAMNQSPTMDALRGGGDWINKNVYEGGRRGLMGSSAFFGEALGITPRNQYNRVWGSNMGQNPSDFGPPNDVGVRYIRQPVQPGPSVFNNPPSQTPSALTPVTGIPSPIALNARGPLAGAPGGGAVQPEPALEGTAENVARINLRNRFGGEEQNPNIKYNYNVASSVTPPPPVTPIVSQNPPTFYGTGATGPPANQVNPGQVISMSGMGHPTIGANNQDNAELTYSIRGTAPPTSGTNPVAVPSIPAQPSKRRNPVVNPSGPPSMEMPFQAGYDTRKNILNRAMQKNAEQNYRTKMGY